MIFRIEHLTISYWTFCTFGSLQYLQHSAVRNHKKRFFILLQQKFMIIIVFVSLLHIACSWQKKASLTATNNISLVYITVNWSAAAVRIITCWCLRLGREASATSSGEFPFFPPSSCSSSANWNVFTQMATEKQEQRQMEGERDGEKWRNGFCLTGCAQKTIWKTLEIAAFV